MSLTYFCFHLDPGDFVEADEIIARIETDKVTVDITSPSAGVIEEYFAAEGDTVDVGADFYKLDTDAKGGSAPKAATPTPAPEAPKVSKISDFSTPCLELLLYWLNILNIIY